MLWIKKIDNMVSIDNMGFRLKTAADRVVNCITSDVNKVFEGQ